MADTFNELYTGLLNAVILERVRQQLAQGVDGIACADAYADQGKPDFVLAHLLLSEASDEIKRDIFARAYEQRAYLSEQKADEFAQKHQRPFPLIKLEAQKDRLSAQQVHREKRIRRGGKALSIN